MKDSDPIPFNRPAITGAEQANLAAVMQLGKFAAGGSFSRRCNRLLEQELDVSRALTTTSCTHALEMAALLCDLSSEDEVVLPSFAFSSTATAFARCGARLVFVDVEPTTMNLDVEAVTAALTSRTRVVVALHYAGVACDMDALGALARRRDLVIVEDAAQAILSEYRGAPCGTLGTFGCFSFHETKNLQCGQGGALLVNDTSHVPRAEIVWEKGTDRTRFHRGEIDKYTWQDIGSSYALGELNAAFLLAQLENGRAITEDRLRSWEEYRERLEPLASRGLLEIPEIPDDRRHNGHIFWIKTRDAQEQEALIRFLGERSIQSVFHYVPLHSSPAGRRLGRFAGEDRFTTRDASRLVRLPLFHGFSDTGRVSEAIFRFYGIR